MKIKQLIQNNRTVQAIAGFETKKEKTDPRVWIVYILLAVVLFRKFGGLCIYGLRHHTKISPFVFPAFFTSDMKILMYLCFAALMCNAPFVDAHTQELLLRSGRKPWLRGCILYVLRVSLRFTVFLLGFSILMILPSVSFNEMWGSTVYRMLGNLRIADGLDRFLLNILPVSNQFIQTANPLPAFIYTAYFMWLSFAFLGLLIYALNIVSKSKNAGLLTAGFLILMDPVIQNVADYGPSMRYLSWYSPVSWSSVSTQADISGPGYVTLTYVVCAYLFGIILFSAIIMLFGRKMEIRVYGPR